MKYFKIDKCPYIHVYIHTHIHIYIHMYIYTHTHARVHTHTHICKYVYNNYSIPRAGMLLYLLLSQFLFIFCLRVTLLNLEYIVSINIFYIIHLCVYINNYIVFLCAYKLYKYYSLCIVCSFFRPYVFEIYTC